MLTANDIISAGLSAMRLRVNTIASNIANAETTRTPEGGPYRRKDVFLVAEEQKGFQATLDELTLAKPKVQAVIQDTSPGRKVFEPGHPDADEQGFVEYPNVNVVNSMTSLMDASRLYQANVSALKATNEMERNARQIATVF
ncbi:MAG: flagellar basal body rod protein FlgC [Deltaproteobacteria bacterium]|nr:flagellar basal body rod protein FlgC [Deltaproteobacteria bacterium]